MAPSSKQIPIPHLSDKRALLIIDTEPKFLTKTTRRIIPNIQAVIAKGEYDAYIVAEYTDKEKESKIKPKTKWQQDHGAIHADEETLPEILSLIDPMKLFKLVKTTRSLFGTDERLANYLRKKNITEVHIVGLETHDCVLATALDAFDHDFLTFVIEEAVASKTQTHHKAAFSILRKLGLTNHSMKI